MNIERETERDRDDLTVLFFSSLFFNWLNKEETFPFYGRYLEDTTHQEEDIFPFQTIPAALLHLLLLPIDLKRRCNCDE